MGKKVIFKDFLKKYYRTKIIYFLLLISLIYFITITLNYKVLALFGNYGRDGRTLDILVRDSIFNAMPQLIFWGPIYIFYQQRMITHYIRSEVILRFEDLFEFVKSYILNILLISVIYVLFLQTLYQFGLLRFGLLAKNNLAYFLSEIVVQSLAFVIISLLFFLAQILFGNFNMSFFVTYFLGYIIWYYFLMDRYFSFSGFVLYWVRNRGMNLEFLQSVFAELTTIGILTFSIIILLKKKDIYVDRRIGRGDR